MRLIRYNYPEWNALSAIDSLFNQAFESIHSPLDLLNKLAQKSEPTSLNAHLYEDDTHYYLRFELPGLNKEDVQVEIEDRLLTVKAERKRDTDDKDNAFAFSAQRTLTLPEGVKAKGISAQLENGLLTLTLPKEEQKQIKAITVN